MKKEERVTNQRLRYERSNRGWSQKRVADALETTKELVSKWECGTQTPSKYYQEKLCLLFGKSASELGLLPADTFHPQATHEQDMVNMAVRKASMENPSDPSLIGSPAHPISETGIVSQTQIPSIPFQKQAIFSFSPVESASVPTHMTLSQRSFFTPEQHHPLNQPYERLAHALASSSLDKQTLEEIDHITRLFWSLRRKLGYRSVLSGLLGHLESMIQLLNHPRPPSTHAALLASASEAAQYIGAIYFDMQDFFSAQSYYTVALQAAKEAGNELLQATSLGRASSLFIYSDTFHEALATLERAQQFVPPSHPSTILAWILALRAETHAHLHDESACVLHLERAETILQQKPREDHAHGIHFDSARFVGYKGVCFLYLDRARASLDTFQEGTSLMTTLSERQQAIMFVDTAEAYRQQGDIEAACGAALNALKIGTDTTSSLLFRRLQTLSSHLEPWKTSEPVKQLAQQIAMKSVSTEH